VGLKLRWVTFDCFGTLIDWRTGFTSILQPIAGERTRALLDAYHRFERLTEAARPHMLYKEVLASSLVSAARDVDLTLSDHQSRALVDGWHQLPVFADVEPMLAILRASGYRLAVLTNCDDDLFQRTERAFAQPFDLILTAERVGAYKPSPAHFRLFRQLADPDEWTHVACSWFHDIVPAHQEGVPRIWLDRDDTGDDPAMASARVLGAREVPPALASVV
jgi:2-haloacid dehalogenase